MAVTTRRTATGVSVTISLTQEQIDLIGSAAGTMADQLDTALWALARLRSGEETTAEEWCLVVNDLGHQLLPRLTGIYDEATRAAVREGVSHGQLARAMDVSRSTAQTRRAALLDPERQITPGEIWVREGGPQNPQGIALD